MAGQRQKPREELAFKRGGRDRVAEEVPAGASVAGVAVLERAGGGGGAQRPPAPPSGGESEGFPCPENMDLLEESRAMWRMVVPTLRHVAAREYGHLVRWIFWWNEWFKLSKDVASAGWDEPTLMGGAKMRPKARGLQTCEMNLLRFENTLGLNPQARMRLGITFAAEQSALERLKGGVAPAKPARMKAGSR